MSDQQTDFSRAVRLHLESRGWCWGECQRCAASFLARPARDGCYRRGCESALPRTFTAGLRPRFPDQVWKAVSTHFAKAHFVTTNRRDIANPAGRATQFVGAGLQVFEDGIERGLDPPRMPLFVPQPVIRLNYWDAVGVSEATSTSFVNLCTEHAQSSLTEFCRHLDVWMDMLVKLGIRINDTTIVLAPEQWRGGPYSGPCLSVIVRGIEVGDAILIDEGGAEATGYLPIVDFSFGLERIVAVLNPGLRYSLFLGALPESVLPENERAIDRLRTATLMCMAGVAASSRGHGRHLRRAVKDAIRQGSALDFAAAVAHAHDYWSQFITPVRGLHECHRILEVERARARAGEVARISRAGALNQNNSAVSADEACRRLLAGGGDIRSFASCATAFGNRIY